MTLCVHCFPVDERLIIDRINKGLVQIFLRKIIQCFGQGAVAEFILFEGDEEAGGTDA